MARMHVIQYGTSEVPQWTSWGRSWAAPVTGVPEPYDQSRNRRAQTDRRSTSHAAAGTTTSAVQNPPMASVG